MTSISRTPGQKPQIKLILSEAVLCLKDDKDTEDIPKEHTLNVSTIKEQTLAVFSQHTCKFVFFSFLFLQMLVLFNH